MKQEFSDEWEMRMGIKWEMRLGIHVERWHLQNSPTFHISRYLKVLADNSFAERSLLYISITDRYNKRYMTRWNWQCYLRPTNVSQVLVVVTNKSIPSTDTKYAWEKLNSELEMHWGFMFSLWYIRICTLVSVCYLLMIWTKVRTFVRNGVTFHLSVPGRPFFFSAEESNLHCI